MTCMHACMCTWVGVRAGAKMLTELDGKRREEKRGGKERAGVYLEKL